MKYQDSTRKEKKNTLKINHSHFKSTITSFLGFFKIKDNVERNLAH